jgi:hypothetical protein
METQVSGRPVRAWYARPWARVVCVVVLVAGLMMAGVGVAGFMAASDTNDEASATRAQAEVVEDEASTLERQGEEALAAAETATADADALEIDTTAVTDAVLAVRDDTDASVSAGNALTECEAIDDEAAFVSCTRNALTGYEAALATQKATIEDLRAEVAALEEALR